MSQPLHRRVYNAFLSHAHVDRQFVGRLYGWLTQTAGLEVWWDSKEMEGGAAIATGLNSAIEKCRAMIIVGSPEALASGWVRKEINVAVDEQARHPEFRVVPIIVGQAATPSELRGISCILVPSAELTFALALDLLKALHPPSAALQPRNSKDVYISASWHVDDNASSRLVCRFLAAEGFRLVGDSRTQEGFSTDRVGEIIRSCGGFVAIIPFRGEHALRADDGPYKYFVQEIHKARDAGLPTLVFADPRVRQSEEFQEEWQALDTQADALAEDATVRLSRLYDMWQPPVRPHYIFLATELDEARSEFYGDLRRLIEAVTGLPTVIGTDIEGDNLPRQIVGVIQKSFLTIADISGSDDDRFNVNVTVEAGIAYASEVTLRMVARGRPRQPPFMLRTAGQLRTYQNDVEYCGVVRNLCWPFRRRILNRELE